MRTQGFRNMGTHDGHRMRMRERIAMTGTGPLQDHEVLEFLLFSFVPRKNTNEMAHALMDRFGSFAGVLNADASELEKVPGMIFVVLHSFRVNTAGIFILFAA